MCEGTSAINKAFIPVGGVPMVTRVLQTLRTVPTIEQITVVAPTVALEDSALTLADVRRSSGDKIIESVQRGLSETDPDAMMLLATSDAPLLSTQSLQEFAQTLASTEADLVYTIVERKAHERRFPGVPHTWARMRGGIYCGGAVFGMRPRVLSALTQFLDELASARKSPLRLARAFGWDVVAAICAGNAAGQRGGSARVDTSGLSGARVRRRTRSRIQRRPQERSRACRTFLGSRLRSNRTCAVSL